MLTQKLLNITHKISDLQFWLTAYIDGAREDEIELLQQLERNLKSMQAIVREKSKQQGGGKI